MPSHSAIKFKSYTPTGGKTTFIPDDIELSTPQTTTVSQDLLHFLVYIPWAEQYMSFVPPDYRDFFSYVLPYLHTRTTDVHVALCMPYAQQLISQISDPINQRIVYLAFILHDVGWSKLSEAEVASSVGVSGLALNDRAMGPKEKHAVVGQKLAQTLLDAYRFNPPLTEAERSLILDAVLYHDKPWELAANGTIPLEVKLVCDIDHLWSFTHQNFWQDTVRKGVPAQAYLRNIDHDLNSYFITDNAKRLARALLSERAAEVAALQAGADAQQASE